MTNPPPPVDAQPTPDLATPQLHVIQLCFTEQMRRPAKLRLRKRDRGPLAKRNSGEGLNPNAAHGVKRERRNGERIREIVDWNGNRRGADSLESDVGGVDETMWRAVQRHRQPPARTDNIGELREHERRGSFKIGRFGDSGEKLGQALSAELRADRYRGTLTLGFVQVAVSDLHFLPASGRARLHRRR